MPTVSASEVTHHCFLALIITPIAALYSGLRVMNASVLLQIMALVFFLILKHGRHDNLCVCLCVGVCASVL